MFVTASPPFTPPTSLPLPGTPGELGIGATNNTNTFGYWESPIIDVASLAAPLSPGTLNGSTGPGTLYTAQFTVRTSVTVPSQVPQMRLRTSPENLMQADFMVVDSRSDGVFSPTPGGRTYTLPFTPALAASRLMLEFEMLNFNPQDAATGDLLLDTAKLERRDLSFLSSATTEKTYSFALDAEGWTSQSAPPFTSPQFLAEPGALTIKGQLGSSTTFGFWTSPESDVLIDGTRMYIIIFTVESDVPAANRSQVPQFRVRVNETSLHGSAYEAVESKGTADRSPVAGEPQQYVVYFLPPDAATGQGLIESFDFLNFESTDKSDATLKLLGVTIQSVPKPF